MSLGLLQCRRLSTRYTLPDARNLALESWNPGDLALGINVHYEFPLSVGPGTTDSELSRTRSRRITPRNQTIVSQPCYDCGARSAPAERGINTSPLIQRLISHCYPSESPVVFELELVSIFFISVLLADRAKVVLPRIRQMLKYRIVYCLDSIEAS